MKQSFISRYITNFSLAFAKNYRVVLILFVATILAGYLAYAKFLKREGSPAVEVPIVIIQTPYFVDNAEKVDNEITRPIETSIKDLPEISKIQSTTNENFSIIVVNLEQDISSEEGAKNIRDQVESEVTLPKTAEVEYTTVSAGAVDGVNDILISLWGEGKTVKGLQDKANEIKEETAKTDQIKEVNVIELITKQTNPITKELIDFKDGFNRLGIRENGSLKFVSAVNIGVVKSKNAGLIDASDALHNKIYELKDEGKLDGFDVSFGGDFAVESKKQIDSLERNAFSALIAVIVILFLFLNWRASIAAAIFIPTVMAATFAALFLIGYDLNFIVLYSIILVLGLFIDDAIVVIEAVDYHKRGGKRGLAAVKAAIKDIGVADLLGTVTTFLVFTPMVFISGILGDFIRFIPVTVMIALALSLIIALSFITFLSRFLVPNYSREIRDKRYEIREVNALSRIGQTIFSSFPDGVRWLSGKVGQFVKWYLKKPLYSIIMLILSLGLIGLGGFYASKLKFAIFTPPKDSDTLTIFQTFPAGTTVDGAERVAKEVEKIIISEAGDFINEVSYMDSDKNQAFLYIQLMPRKERDITSAELVERLDGKFKNFKKSNVKTANGHVGGPPQDFQFFAQVFGEDQKTLKKASDDLKNFLKDKEIISGEKVENVGVDYLNTISKIDGKRAIQVKAKVSDPDNSALSIELQDQVKEEYDKDKLLSLNLEEDALGFDQGIEGEFQESFNSAFFALMIAIVVMYIILVVQYTSFSLPLLILLAIPFTFAGVFPGLFYTGNNLSFFVMIGLIALSGIVVNNTIMLIDFANRRRLRGQGIREAIVNAITIRFRPIVTTTITTIVALIPLALSDPFWESMVYTVIFGLIASTVLVVLAFPIYYAIIEKIRRAKSGLGVRLREKLELE